MPERLQFPGLAPVAVGEETQHVACEHDPAQNSSTCRNLPTIRCQFPDDGADGGYYCQSHCEDAGFCYLCGQFWAGIESFDFAEARGGIKGVCENCADQIKADAGEYLDDEEHAYEGDAP